MITTYHIYWKYKESMTGIIVVSILIFARRDSYEMYNCLDVLLSWAIKTPCLNYLRIWNVMHYNVHEIHSNKHWDDTKIYFWGIKITNNIGAIFFTTPIIFQMRWYAIDHQVKTIINIKVKKNRRLKRIELKVELKLYG